MHLDDNAETIRAIQRRFDSARGHLVRCHLVLTIAPGSGAVEDLIRSAFMRLNVRAPSAVALRDRQHDQGGDQDH